MVENGGEDEFNDAGENEFLQMNDFAEVRPLILKLFNIVFLFLLSFAPKSYYLILADPFLPAPCISFSQCLFGAGASVEMLFQKSCSRRYYNFFIIILATASC